MAIFDEVDNEIELDIDADDDMESFGSELGFITESLTEQMRMITVLEAIAYDSANGKITTDQARYVSFAIESAFNNDPERLKEVLAMENIIERIYHSIVRLFAGIKFAIKKQADYMQYSYTFFNLQLGRIRKIRDKLHQVSGSTAEIRVGVNKYLLFGNAGQEVSSMDEYMKRYLEFTKAMAPFIDAVGELTEEDLFSSLKFYKEYIFGEPEDYVRERFNSLERSLNKAMAGLTDKKTESKPAYVEYDSGTMLGLSRVVVRLPQKNTYSVKDYGTMVTAHKYFYMYVDRRVKFSLGNLFSGNIRLTVKKSDIEKILNESEQLIKKVNELLKMSTQLSHMGSAASVSYTMMAQKRSATDEYDQTAVVKGMQIFTRICSIIFDSSSSGYNFSLGNIKQALTISEKAIQKF